MSIKQVILIRKDLNMRRGKEIAQGGHAVLKVFLQESSNLTRDFLWSAAVDWLASGQTKITLQVNAEAELLDLYNKAKNAKLHCSLIQDSGRTEFNGIPTYTAVAIGPENSEEIDKITSHLKLY